MNNLLRKLWSSALIAWKEPRAFKRVVARAYRQASPLRWFVLTLGLPFIGGVGLMIFPYALGLLQGRAFVPSAPFTFIGLGVIFGILFTLCSLWLQYMSASISCYKHHLIVNTGGRVQRYEYKDLTRFEIIVEVIDGQELRALALSTNYGDQLMLGIPSPLDLKQLIQTLQASGIPQGQAQYD